MTITPEQQELLRVAHLEWTNNDYTLTFFSNLSRKREKLLREAEETAATPSVNRLEIVSQLLLMARTYQQIIDYAKQNDSIIRSK